MIMTMHEAEPSVRTVLLAYDENDHASGNAILISNMTRPADVESLLKEALNSATIKRVLKNQIK
jgi:hypothetical protein